jgi:hypothetical protein
MMSTVEQDPVGAEVTSNDVAFGWRCERYEEMGFETKEAKALANSHVIETTGGKDKNSKKVEWRTPLPWAKVKTALDAGCTHAQALEIFLTV